MNDILANLFSNVAYGTGACADKLFLGLVPWYHYLHVQMEKGVCTVTDFTVLGGHSSFLLVALALIDDMLRVAGLLAVAFMIFAGIQFIMSNGDPQAAAKARTGAFNALIGLAIAMVSISFVAYLGNQASGGTGGSSVVGLDFSILPNPAGVDNGNIIQTVLGIVFAVMGALSFMIIVIGGFRYVLSQGDPSAVTGAKNMIIYALVGLVLAIAAQSIVGFAAGGAP